MSKMFANIIIVSDLDGTFVDDNSQIVPKNIDKIEYFKKNGGSFTFATGRATAALLGIIPNAKEICNIPAILCNGAYIYDFEKEEKHEEIFLPKEKSFKLLKTLREKFPNIGVRIIVGDYNACPIFTQYLLKEKAKSKFMPYNEISIDEIKDENWSKAVFVADTGELKQIQNYVFENPDDDFVFCFSSPHLFEIQAKEATKAKKLPILKKYIGKNNAKLFAIGDEENDRIMLMNADYAAAPKNAIQAIQDLPNIIKVCSNNEGAIKGLIEDIEININIYKA